MLVVRLVVRFVSAFKTIPLERHDPSHLLTHPPLPHSLPPSLALPPGTAQTAWEKSCYFKIDFKITEDAMMYEAVQR